MYALAREFGWAWVCVCEFVLERVCVGVVNSINESVCAWGHVALSSIAANPSTTREWYWKLLKSQQI